MSACGQKVEEGQKPDMALKAAIDANGESRHVEQGPHEPDDPLPDRVAATEM